MKVKICGIKSRDTALFTVESGADALGFVFAESKRRITPEKARSIIEGLPSNIWKVGVFVNEEAETVKRIAEYTGLTHIQLHGQEQPEDFAGINLPIIKSMHVSIRQDIEKNASLKADYLLLDSPPDKYQGGNGMTFDWNLAERINGLEIPIILAGGLTPENISTAIKMVNPSMVDVSSGVETDGEKDFIKIRKFIANAKKRLGEAEGNADKNI